ncbi:MAG: hypothetical protein M3063_13280 [Actinomycetota bacterium]|nr:hypothetical protein [Actinomycetota bacterium]
MAAPWLLGVLGILAAFAVTWLADIIDTFQHFPGLPARARVFRFFAVGNLNWALALLVAVLILTAGTRLFAPPPPSLAPRVRLLAYLVVGATAVVIVSAAVTFLVDLSLVGQHLGPQEELAHVSLGLPAGINQAFVAALIELAVLPIAGAAGLWAYRFATGDRPGR